MAAVPSSLFGDIPKQIYPADVADAFKSCLIEGYERAVESGLQPLDALAIVLIWAADEIRRLDPSGSWPPA
jgi:hypothetical protein